MKCPEYPYALAARALKRDTQIGGFIAETRIIADAARQFSKQIDELQMTVKKLQADKERLQQQLNLPSEA